MGHLFEVECCEKTSQWVLIWFIMAKEIRKGNGKGFGKARWHLFIKIMEIGKKGW